MPQSPLPAADADQGIWKIKDTAYAKKNEVRHPATHCNILATLALQHKPTAYAKKNEVHNV